MVNEDERNQDMANEDESNEDLESSEHEDGNMDESLEKFGKFREERRKLPWNQWTFLEKTNFYLDRMFLGFLAIFLLVFLGDCIYKVWYLTNVKAIAAFVSDVTAMLFGWLFAQEGQEELKEL